MFVRSVGLWKNLPGSHGDNDVVIFYDSIMAMLMSLNTGDINEMEVPGVVGAYIINKVAVTGDLLPPLIKI